MPDVDTAAAVEQTTTDSAAQVPDNASAGSASAGNLTSEPTGGNSADAGSANAGNQQVTGSQAPSNGNTEADAVSQPASTNWESHYKAAQAWATKEREKSLNLQRRLEELEQQTKVHQQKQSEPQLRPWDEGHPEHAQFLRLVDKAEYYDELIQGEDNPELVKALQQKQLRMLGDTGVQTLREWRDDVRRQDRERRLNPKAYYSKLIRQEAQPVVQETLKSTSQNYQEMIQARDQAQKWVKDNPEVATRENIQAVLTMMEKGIKFDQASAQIERDHYRNLVSNAKKMSASAEEKERLLQGNAAGVIHRNPNASKRVDVAKLRKDKGIQDSRGFTDLLFDLDNQGML